MAAVRKKHEQERDRNIVAEYYVKGYSTRAIAQIIADKVGGGYTLNHNTVSNDVKYLLKQWQNERINDINEQKVLELSKLDKLEQTYWQAWEKSIEDHKKSSKKLKGKGDKPDYKEMTETEVVAYGNPAYLAGIERCIDKRCKILGIDAPQKHDITTGGKPFQGFNFLPDAQPNP
ncbi:hypothetical protein C8N40_111101 [Pontibacter mucosus]|uniref:Uncharacterized protein n=1 Tax=Pontibacter mucosus TaxID=1649266 RepID=A0A2T5YD39_9BACT|nr:hypothetical protein [Pontibacter mucosus]PTX14436.1 hypothetical protein C8N40_111101 [Pontibacter mucosus]